MIISKTTLRLMLSYLEIDEHGIDATYRILKEISHEEAISALWTLLSLIFPQVDASEGRAAWEQWLQNGITGPIAPIPDTVAGFDFGGER